MSSQATEAIESELLRRHKVTATRVGGLMGASVLLAVVAYVGRSLLRQQNNSYLDMALRITILIFGLGSIALRRTRFATMRLQDIGALGGASALLRTLEKTTIQVALIGVTISVMGFIATLLTGNGFYTYGSSLVAIFVMLYCFPTLSSWRQTLLQFAQVPDDPATTRPG